MNVVLERARANSQLSDVESPLSRPGLHPEPTRDVAARPRRPVCGTRPSRPRTARTRPSPGSRTRRRSSSPSSRPRRARASRARRKDLPGPTPTPRTSLNLDVAEVRKGTAMPMGDGAKGANSGAAFVFRRRRRPRRLPGERRLGAGQAPRTAAAPARFGWSVAVHSTTSAGRPWSSSAPPGAARPRGLRLRLLGRRGGSRRGWPRQRGLTRRATTSATPSP